MYKLDKNLFIRDINITEDKLIREDEYYFDGGFFNTNNIKESFDKFLLKNLNSKLIIIEIGSYQGQSTCYFLNNFMKNSKSKLYSLDTFEGSIDIKASKTLFDIFKHNIKITKKDNQVIIKKKKSFYGLSELIKDNIKADIIYIDGSHLACDVLSDLVLSWQCCKVGGIIICDDYLWFYDKEKSFQQPKIAIDGFINVYFDKISIIRGWTNYQIAFKKMKE